MIEIFVKTLDSTNYSFSVDDNVTIQEFKAIIAETVNIPVESQRLIFCGRVLKDEKKLTDYDAAGQTLHLVQKPPPSLRDPTTQSHGATQSGSSPRFGRTPVDDSSILVGAFSLPQDALDANGLQQVVENVVSGMGEIGRNATVMSRTSEDGSSVDVHINLGHVPLHSEVQQRINHANRILRFINRINDELEREDAARNGRSMPDNGQNATSDSLGPTSLEAQITAQTAGAFAAATANAFSQFAGAFPPQIVIQGGSVGPNLGGMRINGNNNPATDAGHARAQLFGRFMNQFRNNNNEGVRSDANATNTRSLITVSELTNLLTAVQSAEQRYRTHLQRLQQLITDDSSLNASQASDAQRLYRSVFRAMHHFSHVYHIISDLSLNFSQTPPRNLSVLQSYPFAMSQNQYFASRQNRRSAATNTAPTSSSSGTDSTSGGNAVPNANTNSSAESTTTVSSTPTSTSLPRFTQINTSLPNSSVFVAQSPIVFMDVGSAHIDRIPSGGPMPFSTQTQSNPSATNGSAQPNRSAQSQPNLPPPFAPSYPYSTVFDPFLPCHSHYSIPEIRTRLSVGISANAVNPNDQTQRDSRQPPVNPGLPFQNILSGIMNAVLGHGTTLGAQQQRPPPASSISVDSSLIDLMGRLNNESPSQQSDNGNNEQNDANGTTEMFRSFVNGILQIMNGENTPGTVADFLNQVNGFAYSAGESLANDVFMTMARVLNFQDLFQIFFGQHQPLNRVREVLQTFVLTDVLHGEDPTDSNIERTAQSIIDKWEEGIRIICHDVSIAPEIDFNATFVNLIRINLIRLIHFLSHPPEVDFGLALHTNFRTMISHIVTLCFVCFSNGVEALETMVNSMIRHVSSDLHPLIQQWMFSTATRHVRDSMTNFRISPNEVTHYIVYRHSRNENEDDDGESIPPLETVNSRENAAPQSQSQENMDVSRNEPSEEYSDIDIDSESPPNEVASNNMPSVMIGSESWHSSVPREWVPIISRDFQSQRRQVLARPFSDGYLNGLPKKKRKVDQRPQNFMQPSAFRDSLSQAIASAGVRPVSARNNEEILTEASGDSNLQDAFEEELRLEVKNRIENDDDYNGERFVNTNNYFASN